MNPFKDFKVTTRHSVNEKIRKNKHKVTPLNSHQRSRVIEAHHSMLGQRKRLGMPLVGAGPRRHIAGDSDSGPRVGQDYAALNSTSGFILNLLTGMTYGDNGGDSKCYNAAESFIISTDTSSDIIKKLYITAYWAEAQVTLQDFIAISSGLFVDCQLTQLFNTVSHLASSEGVSQVGGRVAGALPFEMSRCIETYNDPDSFNTQEKGYRYGKCLSIILNYTI